MAKSLVCVYRNQSPHLAILFELGTLSLTDVVERSGLKRTICFRLLRTLEEEGLLRRNDRRKYATNVRILSGKRLRIGYASQTHDSFGSALVQGLRWSAEARPL